MAYLKRLLHEKRFSYVDLLGISIIAVIIVASIQEHITMVDVLLMSIPIAIIFVYLGRKMGD